MENIQIGRIVKVKEPFTSESGEEFQGKTGIVRLLFDADPMDPETIDEVLVDWTPETLDTFPPDHFYDAFDEEISWASYILPARVLEQTEDVWDENDLQWKKQELFTRLFLSDLRGAEGKMIARAFEKPVDPEKVTPMDCWKAFLEQSLRFPVKVKVVFPYEEDDGPVQENDLLGLTGLNGVDRSLGILAEVTDGERDYVLPLQDLDGKDEYSKDAKYIQAYGLWLVCNS